MPKLIRPDASAHWYARDGSACYEIPKKNGNGMKRPTIRDARELDLVPSVTSIIKMMPKPELQAWIQEQILKVCYENPKAVPGETIQEYAKRVLPLSDAQRNKAAEHGKAVHDAIHHWLVGDFTDDIFKQYGDYIDTFATWFLSESVSRTQFASEVEIKPVYGYGGRFDLQFTDNKGKPVIADIKVQNKTDDKDFNFYKDFGMQLAAYKRAMYQVGSCRQISVVLSATNPKRIETFEWQDQEDKLYQQFERCFGTWRFLKNWEG